MVEPTDLLGTWRLERRIVARGVGRRDFGHVNGTLTLAPDGSTIRWREMGTMTWNATRLAVTRTLRLRPDHVGWMVCFEDGTEFHPWRPGVRVVHPCRDDTYDGLVDVDSSRTELRVLWDVTGPAKDLRLFTRCTRTLR